MVLVGFPSLCLGSFPAFLTRLLSLEITSVHWDSAVQPVSEMWHDAETDELGCVLIANQKNQKFPQSVDHFSAASLGQIQCEGWNLIT